MLRAVFLSALLALSSEASAQSFPELESLKAGALASSVLAGEDASAFALNPCSISQLLPEKDFRAELIARPFAYGLAGSAEYAAGMVWQTDSTAVAAALGVSRFSYGELYHETVASLATAVALRLGDRRATVGVRSRIGDVRYTSEFPTTQTLSIDMGVRLDLGHDLELGAAFSDLINAGEADRLLTSSFGLSYLISEQGELHATATHRSYERLSFALGAEAKLEEALTLRVGFSNNAELTGGLSIPVAGLELSGVYHRQEFLGDSFTFGLACGL